MSEIRLEDGTIEVNGEWLSAEDLKAQIKEKMDSGEMKFADLAAALEQLNKAMENAHHLEVRLVIPKADYEKLISAGGKDPNAAVRKAVLAYLGGGKADAPKPKPSKPEEKAPEEKAPEEKAPEEIRCTKCKTPVSIPSKKRPLELECDFCGTSILLEAEEKEAPPPEDDGSGPKRQDHFIG